MTQFCLEVKVWCENIVSYTITHTEGDHRHWGTVADGGRTRGQKKDGGRLRPQVS